MEEQNIARRIEGGSIFSPLHGARSLPSRYSNPGWPGVTLVDLASGVDTKEVFTSHLVRIAKGCEVSDHLHESQWEWNAILDGYGKVILGGREIPFKPGDTFTTPPGVRHTVVAGKEDVALLAVFVPDPA